MIPRNLESEIIRAEDVLIKNEHDFSAKYLAVCYLRSAVRTSPEIIRSETILALNGIFHNSSISSQTQSFFLFREAAKVLCLIAINPIGRSLAEEAYAALLKILGTMAAGGGRLDRWLDSCSYPNFGITGIRDLEHLLSFKGRSRSLYGHIGTQLLSMFLVAGSYFRNKDRGRVGFDEQGEPVDVRNLFDKELLKEIIRGIFGSYYNGFVGKKFRGILPFDFDGLVTRMVDEMGVNTYMDEVLRVVDQREMTDEAFTRFLEDRGYSKDAAKGFQKGLNDITIYTGPHLGGFNQKTSLPELIESVGSMSALCIFGRYCRGKFVKREE